MIRIYDYVLKHGVRWDFKKQFPNDLLSYELEEQNCTICLFLTPQECEALGD